jgi:hypothetical protein
MSERDAKPKAGRSGSGSAVPGAQALNEARENLHHHDVNKQQRSHCPRHDDDPRLSLIDDVLELVLCWSEEDSGKYSV